MSLALRLIGKLDIPALEAAMNDLQERHESLRTLIDVSDALLAQMILDPDDMRVTLAPLPLQPDEVRIPSVLPRGCHSTSPGSLISLASLGTWSEDEHVLLIVVHHVAADGASLAPLARDLAPAYGARLAGNAPDWQPLPLQYADYALWQQEQEALLRRQLAFWRSGVRGSAGRHQATG